MPASEAEAVVFKKLASAVATPLTKVESPTPSPQVVKVRVPAVAELASHWLAVPIVVGSIRV